MVVGAIVNQVTNVWEKAGPIKKLAIIGLTAIIISSMFYVANDQMKDNKEKEMQRLSVAIAFSQPKLLDKFKDFIDDRKQTAAELGRLLFSFQNLLKNEYDDTKASEISWSIYNGFFAPDSNGVKLKIPSLNTQQRAALQSILYHLMKYPSDMEAAQMLVDTLYRRIALYLTHCFTSFTRFGPAHGDEPVDIKC